MKVTPRLYGYYCGAFADGLADTPTGIQAENHSPQEMLATALGQGDARKDYGALRSYFEFASAMEKLIGSMLEDT